jgi:hypothetical protein
VILVRRAAALMLALIVSALPLALERCRTACVQASASQAAASATHACHETANADVGPTVTPSPRACGHSDDDKTANLTAVRSTARLDHAIAPPPIAVPSPVRGLAAGPVPARPPDPLSAERSRNLPLRL